MHSSALLQLRRMELACRVGARGRLYSFSEAPAVALWPVGPCSGEGDVQALCLPADFHLPSPNTLL